MQWRQAVRVGNAARRNYHPVGAIVAAALAACAGGCSSLPQSGRTALASAAPGSTVTFESIDGPPPEVFRRLVASLNDEASARKIAVVSRSSAATYRVRGYVSALVERDKTTFAWVWDVYDNNKRRTLRLSGEEAAGAIRRRDARAGAWTAADEQVLRHMARSGMEQMADFLNGSEQLPAAVPQPEPSLVTLVSRRDDSPEAAGIFRLFGGSSEPAPAPAPIPAAVSEPDNPTPAELDKPTKSAKTRNARSIAASTDGRSARPYRRPAGKIRDNKTHVLHGIAAAW
jgi:hypothetical protein